MDYQFRQASQDEIPQVWAILQKAILRRKAEGSNQWQDGYPNETIVIQDIKKGVGNVLIMDGNIVGYCAVLINDEPQYDKIVGQWITNCDFMVFHRVAIAEDYLGKGLAKKLLDYIEELARKQKIPSLKADTNFDNAAMLAIFAKLGYTYCGEVYFRGSPRKAFEKVLI